MIDQKWDDGGKKRSKQSVCRNIKTHLSSEHSNTQYITEIINNY